MKRPAVADAAVELLAGDRIVGQLEFNEAARAFVFRDSTLQAGETYSLQVWAPGFETIRATDTVPVPVPTSVQAYRTDASSRSESGRDHFSIKLKIQDPPGEESYYQINLYHIDMESRFQKYFSTRDPSIQADNSVNDGSPFEEGEDSEGRTSGTPCSTARPTKSSCPATLTGT